jgi:Holliday junction resolvase-like predicted endonuclease
MTLACPTCGDSEGLRLNSNLSVLTCSRRHTVLTLQPEETAELRRRVAFDKKTRLWGTWKENLAVLLMFPIILLSVLFVRYGPYAFAGSLWLFFALGLGLVLYIIRRFNLGTPAATVAQVEEVREYCAARHELADRQLGQREYLEGLSPRDFEYAVARILQRRGYELVQMGAGVADFGADVLVRKDNRTAVVQVKQWANPVQRQELQKLQGAMAHFGADTGIFVTLSRFSSKARDYGREQDIILIDGQELLRDTTPTEQWLFDDKRHLLNEVAFSDCGHHLRVWVRGALNGKKVNEVFSFDYDSEDCPTCVPHIRKVIRDTQDGFTSIGLNPSGQ